MSEESTPIFEQTYPATPRLAKLSFTAGLIILSPILFAGHKVVGKNHTVDARNPAGRAIFTYAVEGGDLLYGSLNRSLACF